MSVSVCTKSKSNHAFRTVVISQPVLPPKLTSRSRVVAVQTNYSNRLCVLFTEGVVNSSIKICPISQPSFPEGSTQNLHQSQSSRLIRSVRERSDMWHAVRRAPSSGVKQPEPEANHHLVLSSCVSRVAPWLCPCGVQLRCCLQPHRSALLLLLHLNNARSSLTFWRLMSTIVDVPHR